MGRMKAAFFDRVIGIVGHPTTPDVAWSDEQLGALRDAGFETLQLRPIAGRGVAAGTHGILDDSGVAGEQAGLLSGYGRTAAAPLAARRCRPARDRGGRGFLACRCAAARGP